MGLGIALAIGGALLSAASSAKGASASRAAARESAALTYDQRMEEIRRLSQEQRYTEGLITARAASAGVEQEGTPLLYQQFIKQEHETRITYAQESAKQERSVIRHGGTSPAAANLNAASGLLSSISSMIPT